MNLTFCKFATGSNVSYGMVIALIAYAVVFFGYMVSGGQEKMPRTGLELFNNFNFFLPSKHGWFGYVTLALALFSLAIFIGLSGCGKIGG